MKNKIQTKGKTKIEIQNLQRREEQLRNRSEVAYFSSNIHNWHTSLSDQPRTQHQRLPPAPTKPSKE